MSTEYLSPDGAIINETSDVEAVTPLGMFLNESGTGQSSGVPKSTKFSLLGVG